MSEFALIDLVRARCAHARRDVALGIGDDAALLDVPAGRRLVACTDTLVEGVHFPRGSDPEGLGWKALAVNLSDLAAMGADPAWALLALTLPDGDAGFVARFAEGFAALADAHDVALVGGDTTQGPFTVTVTAMGLVPQGAALTRAGAQVGDVVWVSGTLGDAAGALHIVRDPNVDATRNVHSALLGRLHRPTPRVAAGLALRGMANACIDVSDGLLADLGHVCRASGVGAEIWIDALPVSEPLGAAFDPETCRMLALTGGDDYELCFSAPEDGATQVESTFAGLGLRVTRIGRIVAGSGVRVLDAAGVAITPRHAGWEHFRQDDP